MRRIIGTILKLRIEEAIAVIFLGLSAAVTIKAYIYFAADGNVPRYIQGGIWRLMAVLLFFLIIHISAKLKHRFRFFYFLRETLPFGLAIAVYTNLHDTIAFINSNDISSCLIRADIAIFGVEPVLWAQKFYHPVLTKFFSFCYLNFFAYSIILGGWLYFRDNRSHFREMMLGVVFCFYARYFLYILFPAVPPRITLLSRFTRTLDGSIISNTANRLINISLATSRAAFPSLHCANTILNMLYSFRFKKAFFYAFLPIGTGLILGTVYLRHHYVVDIIAGIALAILVYFVTPRLSTQWERWQKMAIRQKSSD